LKRRRAPCFPTRLCAKSRVTRLWLSAVTIDKVSLGCMSASCVYKINTRYYEVTLFRNFSNNKSQNIYKKQKNKKYYEQSNSRRDAAAPTNKIFVFFNVSFVHSEAVKMEPLFASTVTLHPVHLPFCRNKSPYINHRFMVRA